MYGKDIYKFMIEVASREGRRKTGFEWGTKEP